MNINNGRYGEFGGMYVPETLMSAINELNDEYMKDSNDKEFLKELSFYLDEYAGRPSRLYFAQRLTNKLGGAKVYLKREDLNHTGSHKINNVLGQALLAKKMGKKRVIAETGAGQHGVAAATAAALFDMECEVFMGTEDMERQSLNVFRMNLLGAKVNGVSTGTGTLKDATNEALREWARSVEDTFYIIGSVVGPHPYPQMVRDFQSIIGKEVKEQIIMKEGRLPDCLIACVGGGSNAMGLFYPFIDDKEVRLIGVEAAGKGIDTEFNAASVNRGSVGVIHGMKTYMLQDKYGNIKTAHSVSAGLDYPGVGPEHAHLYKSKRAEYHAISDKEAISALVELTKTEGILPALESAHAIACLIKIAPSMSKESIIVVNVSGRGDKDVHTIKEYFDNMEVKK